MTRHGQLYRSGNVPPRSLYYDRGRFGRLFPSLPPFAADHPSVRDNLLELGKPGGVMDANDQPPPANPLAPNPSDNSSCLRRPYAHPRAEARGEFVPGGS